MDYENIWSVNDVVKNRNNWSLAADSELLKHLQHLSKVDFTLDFIKLEWELVIIDRSSLVPLCRA